MWRATTRSPSRFRVRRHQPGAGSLLSRSRRGQTARGIRGRARNLDRRRADECVSRLVFGCHSIQPAGRGEWLLVNRRSAASAELLGSISFVASVYLLLYAVVQFVSGSAGTLATHCVFIVAMLVPPIGVFFIEATLSDLALALADPKTKEPLEPLRETANNLSIPIALTVVIICATMWHVGRKRRRSPSSPACWSSRARRCHCNRVSRPLTPKPIDRPRRRSPGNRNP